MACTTTDRQLLSDRFHVRVVYFLWCSVQAFSLRVTHAELPEQLRRPEREVLPSQARVPDLKKHGERIRDQDTLKCIEKYLEHT